MKIVRLLIVFALLVAGHVGFAQKGNVAYNLPALLQTKQIETVNRETTLLDENGKKGIHLSAKENDGVAWLKGIDFADGTIELDIRGKDVLQQSFLGVAFHGAAEADAMEVIYFRPFNFRAADPVRKIHAVQYVSLPKFDWELLREKFNGQYEKGIDPAPAANEWFHARIVVKGGKVSVYVNHNPQPSLTVKMLSDAKKGKIGLWVGNNSDGDFANLTVSREN